jgi:iron complex outermembrane receptor protein
MHKRYSRALCATTALATGILLAGNAFAQSTGTQTVNELVVTGSRGPVTLGGVVTAETAPKSRSSINQEFISTQPAGQTILQSLNVVPGLNFTNNDPYGGSGGNLRLRGFDGNRISLTFDGIPLNDTGNYAVYSNQQLDSELISQANVNTGTTDADTPSISSTGGVINYTVVKPKDQFGVVATAGVGSFNYQRYFAQIDTGRVGPLGTKAWFAASYMNYDKFKGEGDLKRTQYNFRIWQDLWKDGDFISIAGHWNENRNYNYYAPNLGTSDGSILPEVESNPAHWGIDYISPWVKPSVTPGVKDNDANSNNTWTGRINPSNTGNIRIQSSFSITDNLRLTIDPSFQYVLANGGTQVVSINENDAKLVGKATVFSTCKVGAAGQKGVDLNGDGDCLDAVRYMSPSTTNTQRYGLNSSLIWDITPEHRLRLAYTLDDGHHRQTSEGSFVDQSTGHVADWFGGKDGYGPRLYAADGALIRFRDRFSLARLNQVALEYRGQFFDDRLSIVAAVQHKTFERELNQFCFTENGTSNALCTTEPVKTTLANGNVQFGSQGTKQYIPPFSYNVSFSKTLPNVGATWLLSEHQTIFADYAEQLSALRTDSFYTVQRKADGTIGSLNAQPETTKTWEVGYRYQARNLLASITYFNTDFQNRIVSTYDPDTDTFRERNVGSVKLKGFEGQAAYRVDDHVTFGANVSYNDAKYQNALQMKPGVFAPIQGKQMVETPRWMTNGWLNVNVDGFNINLTSKWVGRRFVTDMNDMSVPAYVTFDASVRYNLSTHLPGVQAAYLQLNVWNLGDEQYYGSLGTQVTGNPALKTLYGVTNQPFGYIGAPRTTQLSLRVEF